MKLSRSQVEEYRRNGVLPLGRVLEPELVEQAREHLEKLRADKFMDAPLDERNRKMYRLLDVHTKDAWFDCIIRHPAVLDAAESILGPNLQFFQDNIFYKPARDGSITNWHQDNIWWNINPPHALTVWIALDDVDQTNGGVQYVPGCHGQLIDPELEYHDVAGSTYKVLKPEQVDLSKAISFTVPTGHAVMHHCLTPHGAPANLSDRPRRGYTVHIAEAGTMKFDAKFHKIVRGKYPEPALAPA